MKHENLAPAAPAAQADYLGDALFPVTDAQADLLDRLLEARVPWLEQRTLSTVGALHLLAEVWGRYLTAAMAPDDRADVVAFAEWVVATTAVRAAA